MKETPAPANNAKGANGEKPPKKDIREADGMEKRDNFRESQATHFILSPDKDFFKALMQVESDHIALTD